MRRDETKRKELSLCCAEGEEEEMGGGRWKDVQEAAVAGDKGGGAGARQEVRGAVWRDGMGWVHLHRRREH